MIMEELFEITENNMIVMMTNGDGMVIIISNTSSS